MYVGAVYLGVQLYGDRQEPRRPTEAEVGPGCGCQTHSYVSDPKRNETYEQIAYAYDSQIEKDELVMGIHLMRRALLYFHAKGEVLEVGAGTGRNLGYYPDEATVSKVTLTDIGDKMLEQAREKIRDLSPKERRRYAVAVADAAHLRYPDDAFDTVVDSFGLCSFDDPVAVLRELQRVCKPDGRILLLEHGRSRTWEGLTAYLDKYAERHARNWGCCWNRDIERIVADAGLEVERRRMFHFGTTYYLVCKPRGGGGR